MQDGSSAWVVPMEVLQNAYYQTSKADLKQYLADKGINLPHGVNTFKEVLENYGTIITYTPLV